MALQLLRRLAIGVCFLASACVQDESRSIVLPDGTRANAAARTADDRRVDDQALPIARKSPSILDHNGKKSALVIGIGAYQGVAPLRNPTNDALVVGRSFRQIGFDVEQALDQDYDSLKTTLGDHFATVQDNYLNVIYFAGHAFQIGGENYLLPADFSPEAEQEDDIYDRLISLNELLDLVETSATGRTMIILDACRNNPYVDSVGETLSETSGRSVAVGQGLAEPAIVRSSTDEVLFLYATAPGRFALDGEGENSPFAEALSEWVVKPDVMLDDAIRGLRRDVAALTDNRQVPFSTNNFSSRFRLNPRFQQLDSSISAEVADLAGTGRLTLRPQMSIWMDQLMESSKSAYAANPGINQIHYVATSLSGANGNYSRCRQKLSVGCDELALAKEAVKRCETSAAEGEACALYAVIRNGLLSQVWQGQVVHFRGSQIPIVFDWEDIGLVAGLADYSSQGLGKLSLEIPRVGGHCTGTYKFTQPGVKGRFQAACENGLTLEARIDRSEDSLDVFRFSGTDSLGRHFKGVFNDDG